MWTARGQVLLRRFAGEVYTSSCNIPSRLSYTLTRFSIVMSSASCVTRALRGRKSCDASTLRTLLSSPAAGEAKCTDTARVVRRALLEIITHVPDRAIITRIDRGLRIVFPTYGILRPGDLCSTSLTATGVEVEEPKQQAMIEIARTVWIRVLLMTTRFK